MKGLIVGTILSAVLPLTSSTTTYVQAPVPMKASETLSAVISGYTSSVDETDDTPFITASGTITRPGIIACPSDLSFGTVVEIDGNEYTCEDRMNIRYRDSETFDIWFATKAEAYQWGRQTLNIKVYERDQD